MLKRIRTLRTTSDLAAAGLIAPDATATLAPVAERYAVAITPAMADLIDASDPTDPIARQFVPTAAELQTTPEERADPIGDHCHSPVEGIVHRYRDRVLLKLTHVCPVYCRFCFRREMVGPGEERALTPEALETAFAYIAAHPEIWETILTGGDPLMLSPRRLADVTRRLSEIPHVKVIRWHTRMPVADPARITPELVRALQSEKPVLVAVHINHARELTENARAACRRLCEAGISLLGQSVLLKGVNDDEASLEALMRAQVEARIRPYYLHHPDLAPGTSHFRVTVSEGQSLVRRLRAKTSGLCHPHYVLDIPGGYAKALLTPEDAENSGNSWKMRDHEGIWHDYDGA